VRRGFVLFGDGKFFKCINRKKVAHGAVSFVGWGVWVCRRAGTEKRTAASDSAKDLFWRQ